MSPSLQWLRSESLCRTGLELAVTQAPVAAVVKNCTPSAALRLAQVVGPVAGYLNFRLLGGALTSKDGSSVLALGCVTAVSGTVCPTQACSKPADSLGSVCSVSSAASEHSDSKGQVSVPSHALAVKRALKNWGNLIASLGHLDNLGHLDVCMYVCMYVCMNVCM